MKNFSTVATRLTAAALVACAVAAPIEAAAQPGRTNCSFRPDAPDQHVVVKGDTLWDISGTFLERPWCWPKVWGMNRDEIRNPHWIYPGQIIYFDRAHGRLSLTKPGSQAADEPQPSPLRMSPQLRTEALGADAVPAIAPGAIEPFLTQPLVVESAELQGAPRIVGSTDGHVYMGQGDKVYVRGDLKGARTFQVFRPGKELRDPQTGALLAHEAAYLGTVNLVREAQPGSDVHSFTITSSNQEMGVGDRLLAAPPAPIRSYVPHAPERQIDARLMSVYAGVSHAGQNQVVTVNRGTVDGLDVGSVLELYHLGKTVPDPTGSKGFLGFGKSTMKLPDEKFGTLFIFRAFGRVSYGLIMHVTEPAQVGDVAKSPE
ncbi:LysM peptidoglycan-binding domain-containing protein [Massilia horti]|uniref:LysM peptidoglycan-binding domain-containing protein n=1 Tax=Massilia horti TaxID=2562153 RepID=A0A4Y9SZB9_9BURK|nr:LysM peptidoglycan-binding domain-containing protein [Massilia horti]TFW29963.1 LysM peptidoglycan-binding domain-containing protein [Massilia horti]